jgi:hypothetical protein
VLLALVDLLPALLVLAGLVLAGLPADNKAVVAAASAVDGAVAAAEWAAIMRRP